MRLLSLINHRSFLFLILSTLPHSNLMANDQQGVGYLVFAKTLREHVPNVFVFMFMIMFAGSMAVLLYLWVSGEYFTFNRDINVGLWGWMNLQSDRLPLEIWMVRSFGYYSLTIFGITRISNLFSFSSHQRCVCAT